MDTKLSVALCTYNGGSFLKEQLRSISNQNLLPDELVVCDDNSKDETLDILFEFAKTAPFNVRVIRNELNLGVKNNFTKAVQNCKGDYIAFCDQDDIWLPNKLMVSVQALQKAEQNLGGNIPILVHTDLKVVDQNNKTISESFLKHQNITHKELKSINSLLVQNFVTGCTTIVNRALVTEALPVPEDAIMHDWWFALMAAARGHIVFIPEQTILYRQHSANVVGSKGFWSIHNFKRTLSIKELEKHITLLFLQGFALEKRLEALTGAKPTFLEEYLIAAKKGSPHIVCSSWTKGIGKQGLVRNVLYYLLLAKGGYKKYLKAKQLVGQEGRS